MKFLSRRLRGYRYKTTVRALQGCSDRQLVDLGIKRREIRRLALAASR